MNKRRSGMDIEYEVKKPIKKSCENCVFIENEDMNGNGTCDASYFSTKCLSYRLTYRMRN